MKKIVLVFLFFYTPLIVLSQNIIFVDASMPDDNGDGKSWATAKKTIQSAIYSSNDGDHVLVKYGEYQINSTIDVFTNRKFTSDNGSNHTFNDAVPDSSKCIIDAQNSCRGFHFHGTNITNECVLKGFKIINGLAESETYDKLKGGAIVIRDKAEPIISECCFVNNIASTNASNFGYGGAIACYTSSWSDNVYPKIRNCSFYNNTANIDNMGFGGAIFAFQIDVDINNCSFNHNQASVAAHGRGGAIFFERGNICIDSCNLSENQAGGTAGQGGALYLKIAHTTLTKCKIKNNIAGDVSESWGGGICCEISTSGEISDNLIEQNTAANHTRGKGGGIFINTNCNDLDVFSNFIKSNVAVRNGIDGGQQSGGGGIYVASDIDIINNLLVKNIASTSSVPNHDGSGGGIFVNSASPDIINNTFFKNATAVKTQGIGHGSGLVMSDANVKNNIFVYHNLTNSDETAITGSNEIFYNAFYQNTINMSSSSCTGCVTGNPLFSDTLNNDFSLKNGSICFNTGDLSTDTTNFSVDYAKNPRILFDTIDIGAFESTGPFINEQPVDVTICETGEAEFSVSASSTETFQWQEKINPEGNWIELMDNPEYSGTSSSLFKIDVNPGFDGYQYRCKLQNIYNQLYSQEVVLSVQNEFPQISSSHTDTSLNANENCQAVVPDYTLNVIASDNCDDDLEILQNPVPGEIISGTINTITLTVKDDVGNQTQAIFNIEVIDKTAPEISCISDQVIHLESGKNYYTVKGTEFDPIDYTDNCGIDNITNDFNSTSSLNNEQIPIGLNTIIWKAIDNEGNENTCTSLIQVEYPVDIDNLHLHGIKIYPNPVKEKCTINFTQNTIHEFCVSTLAGKILIKKTSPIHKKEIIDISNYKNGIYVITISTDHTVFRTKIVKQ